MTSNRLIKERKQRSSRYWYFLGFIWGLSILVIIGIGLYNNYVSRTYLGKEKLNFVNALEIVNDPWYFFWFFIGLVDIFSLVAAPCYVLIKEINQYSKAIAPIVAGFVISIILLIVLLLVYSNPILLAFAFVAMVGGGFMFISSEV